VRPCVCVHGCVCMCVQGQPPPPPWLCGRLVRPHKQQRAAQPIRSHRLGGDFDLEELGLPTQDGPGRVEAGEAVVLQLEDKRQRYNLCFDFNAAWNCSGWREKKKLNNPPVRILGLRPASLY